MRAATHGDLNFPRIRSVIFGSHAFAVSGPMCWSLELSTLIPEIIIHATPTVLETTEDDSHSAAVVTLLQDLARR